jgi:hypothetical protein
MKDSEFRKKMGIIKGAMGQYGLGYVDKKALGQAMKSVLRAVAKSEGWQTGEYDVRYNPGGEAVKGDGVLHGEDLYVSVSPDCAGPGVLVRNCRGRKDYTGGPNGWMPWQTFFGAGSASELTDCIRKIAPRQPSVSSVPSGLAKGVGLSSPDDLGRNLGRGELG